MITLVGTTYFHYNGDKVIAETDANHNITTEYTWDAQGNSVNMTKGGKAYYVRRGFQLYSTFEMTSSFFLFFLSFSLK